MDKKKKQIAEDTLNQNSKTDELLEELSELLNDPEEYPW